MVIAKSDISTLSSSAKVQFYPPMETEQLYQVIQSQTNPHIYTFFLTNRKLPQKWFEYCRDNLIIGVKKISEQAQFYLYDYCAWAQLKVLQKDASTTLTKAYKTNHLVADRLKTLAPFIRYVDSAEFFQFLKQSDNPQVHQYFENTIAKRDFLWMKSAKIPNAERSVRDSLGTIELLKPIENDDTNKTYSILQYLEGYFLIRKILLEQPASTPEVNIIFYLPNDESSYYQDIENSFQTDVSALLQQEQIPLPPNGVNITFLSFPWGAKPSERPYLANGPIIGEKKLGLLDSMIAV